MIRCRYVTLVLGALVTAMMLAACAGPGPGDGAGLVGVAGGGGEPQVMTDVGRLRGVADGAVTRFRGVPYAQSPTGDLRWSPPRPVAPWAGVRDATSSGPGCPQEPGQLAGTALSEDCLFLDVTAWACPSLRLNDALAARGPAYGYEFADATTQLCGRGVDLIVLREG